MDLARKKISSKLMIFGSDQKTVKLQQKKVMSGLKHQSKY